MSTAPISLDDLPPPQSPYHPIIAQSDPSITKTAKSAKNNANKVKVPIKQGHRVRKFRFFGGSKPNKKASSAADDRPESPNSRGKRESSVSVAGASVRSGSVASPKLETLPSKRNTKNGQLEKENRKKSVAGSVSGRSRAGSQGGKSRTGSRTGGKTRTGTITTMTAASESPNSPRKVKIRSSPGAFEKIVALLKILVMVFMGGVVIAAFLTCFTTDGNQCIAFRNGQSDDDENVIVLDINEMIPFIAFIVVVCIFGFIVMLGFQNATYGCLRGPGALQVRPESKFKNMFLSYFGVEVFCWILHIAFLVVTFKVFLLPVTIVLGISLLSSFILLFYKSKRYRRYFDFNNKKRLVTASTFLLALEDSIFLCFSFLLFVSEDSLRQVTAEEDLPSFDKFNRVSIAFLFANTLAAVGRGAYILGFLCCANPVFDSTIISEERYDEDIDEMYNVLTIIPKDVRQELRVRIEKEGAFGLFFYALLPGFISGVLIALFVGAAILDFSEPPLPDDSIFLEDSLKIVLSLISISLLILAALVFFGFKTWTRGCCVPPETHHVIPAKERAFFSMRGLEVVDFITDVGSTALLFKSFDTEIFWQVIMAVSLILTLALNLIYFIFKTNDEHKSYQGKKKKIALSIALLAVEDVFMLPINTIFVIEQPDQFLAVEYAAVVLSAVVGGVMLVIRALNIFYHICCGRPIYTGEINTPTGEIIALNP